MSDTYRIFYFKISDPRERMSSERYGLKLIAKNDSNNAGRTRISIMDSRRCSNVCHSTILKHSRHVCPSSFVEISGKLDCQTLLFQLPEPMGTITDREQQRTPKKTATKRERERERERETVPNTIRFSSHSPWWRIRDVCSSSISSIV